MTSEDLDPAACRVASEQVARQLAYLGRLRERLDAKGLTPADPLRADVEAAWVAVHGLRVRLHYLAVGKVGGAPATAPPGL